MTEPVQRTTVAPRRRRARNPFHSIYVFMTQEPEEHALGDVISGLVQSGEARQSFWEQVEAFRGHLLRAVLGLIVGIAVCAVFGEQLVNFLAIPAGGLQRLQAIDITESVGVYMKVALLGGVILAVPYIAFELWLFAAPGLHARERVYGLLGIPFATLFFAGGVAFTYYVFLPGAIPFLTSFLNIPTLLRPGTYFDFITGMMFWIGICFEFPLVIYLLTSMGIVRPQPLAQQWRIAIVIISVFAAVITPTVDPVNMGLVMLPLIILYFISIGLSFMAYAGRRPRQPAKS